MYQSIIILVLCVCKHIASFENVVPPGGQKVVNISDPNVHAAADFAVNVVNYLSGYSCCTYREQLAEIDNGTSQVVSGWIFRLQTRIGTSFCTNNENNANATEENCPLQPGMAHRGCNFTIRFTPWTDPPFNLMNHTCEPKHPYGLQDDVSHFTIGHTKPVNVSDPFIRLLAERAVNTINKINGFSCCTYKDVLTKIQRGNYTDYNYRSDYDLDIFKADSFCTNNDLNQNTTSKDCPVQPGSKGEMCHIQVEYQFIQQQFSLINHHCYGQGQTPRPFGR